MKSLVRLTLFCIIAYSYIKFRYNCKRVSNHCITGILKEDGETPLTKSAKRRNKKVKSNANKALSGNLKEDWEKEYIQKLKEGPLTQNSASTQATTKLTTSEDITNEIVRLNNRQKEISEIKNKLSIEEAEITKQHEQLTIKLLDILANTVDNDQIYPTNPILSEFLEESEPEVEVTSEVKPLLKTRIPSIDEKELDCLKGNEWLNGATIDLGLYHLTKDKVDYQYFSTFFYQALKEKREQYITKRQNIFSKGHTLIPIHTPGHWSIAEYNRNTNTVYIYDPKNYIDEADEVGVELKEFLEKEAIRKEHQFQNEIKIVITSKYPRQSRGDITNCGIYCLQTIKGIIQEERPFCDNIGKIRKEWRKTLKTYFSDTNIDTEEEDEDIVEFDFHDIL